METLYQEPSQALQFATPGMGNNFFLIITDGYMD